MSREQICKKEENVLQKMPEGEGVCAHFYAPKKARQLWMQNYLVKRVAKTCVK